MKTNIVLVLVLGLIFSFWPGMISHATVINSCQTITQNTTLGSDINFSQTTNPNGCIIFGASNITLDCQNHKLTGDGSGLAVSIKDRSNNTVQNCQITNAQNGVLIQGNANDNLIANVNITRTDFNPITGVGTKGGGVSITSGFGNVSPYGNTITSSTFSKLIYGTWVNGFNFTFFPTTIASSTYTDNMIGANILTNSIIRTSNFIHNGYGVYSEGGGNNISSSIFDRNTTAGVFMVGKYSQGGTSNDVGYNTISNTGLSGNNIAYGVYINGFGNHQVYSNIITNGKYGIYILGSDNVALSWNTIVNNVRQGVIFKPSGTSMFGGYIGYGTIQNNLPGADVQLCKTGSYYPSGVQILDNTMTSPSASNITLCSGGMCQANTTISGNTPNNNYTISDSNCQ